MQVEEIGGITEAQREGAARVRERLVAVLREGGLVAPGKGDEDWWQSAARYLGDRLWHLDAAELDGVAEWARRAAVLRGGRKGARQLEMPELARIVGAGERIRPPRLLCDRLVISWLGSIEGEAAEACGDLHLVATMRGLVRHRGVQPGSPYWRSLVEQDRVALDRALREDEAAQAAFEADLADGRVLVEAGRRKRADEGVAA